MFEKGVCISEKSYIRCRLDSLSHGNKVKSSSDPAFVPMYCLQDKISGIDLSIMKLSESF